MRNYTSSPLYQKSEEIYQTLLTITALIPEDHEMLQDIKSEILGKIRIIQAKLAGAHRAKLWDLRMENAAIIRMNARELMIQNHLLQTLGFEEVGYYHIVRQQLEEFRLLFREWVAGFDPKKFIVDEWGLFNPPGIPQDYEQRSDELNFLDDDDISDDDFSADDGKGD